MAIVGGGFTGLWTAYYLKRADPSLRVCVLEQEVCGYGASGRNGGWVCGAVAGFGDPRTQAAIDDAVDEIGRVMRGRADRVRLPQGRRASTS